MKVKKRDGRFEEVDLNKITKSIQNCAGGLNVDSHLIAAKVVGGLYDGCSTRELDTIAVKTAASFISKHPDYDYLAARLLFQDLKKDQKSLNLNMLNYALWAKRFNLISDECFLTISHHAGVLEKALDHSRDNKFKYLGAQTLVDRYLWRGPDNQIIETPQIFWMRVACGLGGTVEEILEAYELFSTFKYIPSTPTLFNSGCWHPQLASCFLVQGAPHDSIESIYDTYKECAQLSKYAGGLGVSFSDVRSQGSHIQGTNGKSSGIIPFLKTLDASVLAVNQAGKRRGACAVYLEPWHADIEEFLELRKNTGHPDRRTYNLNTALWIPDLFMKRVKIDETWSLMDPAQCYGLTDSWGEKFEKLYTEYEVQGKFVKQVRAQELYAKIMTSLAETGHPYICFKDTSNLFSPQVTENNGYVVRSSNLCVHGSTTILTRDGQKPISSLVNTEVEVWNGAQWSKVVPRKTGVNKKLIKLTFNHGQEIVCTPEHRLSDEYEQPVEARHFKIGQKMSKFKLPVVEEKAHFDRLYYAAGLFTAEGTYPQNGPRISLYDQKIQLAEYFDWQGSGNVEKANITGKRLNCMIENLPVQKYQIPFGANLSERLSWLAGYMDGDGCVTENKNYYGLQVSSTKPSFLKNFQLFLQEMGVYSKFNLLNKKGWRRMPDGKGGHKKYWCENVYRMTIAQAGINRLISLGYLDVSKRLSPESKTLKQNNTMTYNKLVKVEEFEGLHDTYCFNEPVRHTGVFNGILTFNCSEITLVSDDKETAVCNIGSLNLAEHDTLEEIGKTASAAISILDKVIDKNWYAHEKAEDSNKYWRPVGLGLMGWADYLYKNNMHFKSEDALLLAEKIQKTIWKNAVDTSIKLGQEKGPYTAIDETDHDDGRRNSILIAIAPTATIASLAGCFECIEPPYAAVWKRTTLSGDYLQINHYLVNDLIERGLWTEGLFDEILNNGGSVQGMAQVPSDIQEKYKTAFEVGNKTLIDLAAARQLYIDQSQSLNLFVAEPDIGKLGKMYMYCFESDLKTTYYLRSKPKTQGKTTVSACKIDDPDCESCM